MCIKPLSLQKERTVEVCVSLYTYESERVRVLH